MKFNTKKLKELSVNNSGLIFDPSTGYFFTSNETGLNIISALIDSKSKDEIKKYMKSNYEVNGSDLDRDIFEFINQLISYGWIKSL